jgi:hypothetical protein
MPSTRPWQNHGVSDGVSFARSPGAFYEVSRSPQKGMAARRLATA